MVTLQSTGVKKEDGATSIRIGKVAPMSSTSSQVAVRTLVVQYLAERRTRRCLLLTKRLLENQAPRTLLLGLGRSNPLEEGA